MNKLITVKTYYMTDMAPAIVGHVSFVLNDGNDVVQWPLLSSQSLGWSLGMGIGSKLLMMLLNND